MFRKPRSVLIAFICSVLLVTAMVFVFGSGRAGAADIGHIMPTKNPPPYVPYKWDGIYFGGNLGGAIGTAGATSTPTSVLVPNDPADKLKGWMGGGQIGARKQFGKWVFGFEADIDWANITNRANSCNTVRRTFFTTQLADTNSCQTNGTKIDWVSTVTANAGVVIAEKVLWSLKGGLAFAKVTWDNSQAVSTTALNPTGTAFCAAGVISCPNGSAAASDSKVKYGATVGTVLEVALNNYLSLKGEYDYVNLGKSGGPLGSQRADLHIAKFGFNIRPWQ